MIYAALALRCIVVAIVIVRLNIVTRKLKEHGILEKRLSELSINFRSSRRLGDCVLVHVQ